MNKTILILTDGMADEPLAELGGKTPVEYAATPNMDAIAAAGVRDVGRAVRVTLSQQASTSGSYLRTT